MNDATLVLVGALVGGIASAIGNYAVHLRLAKRDARVEISRTIHELDRQFREVVTFPPSDERLTQLVDVADRLTRNAGIVGRSEYRAALNVYGRVIEMRSVTAEVRRSRIENTEAMEKFIEFHKGAVAHSGALDRRTIAYLAGWRDRMRYRVKRLRKSRGS